MISLQDTSSKTTKYADDDQKYTKFKILADGADQKRVYSATSKCINDTKDWGAANKLKYNIEITDALLVYWNDSRIKPSEQSVSVRDAQIFPKLLDTLVSP